MHGRAIQESLFSMTEGAALAWTLVVSLGVGAALLPSQGQVKGLWKVLIGAVAFVVVPILIATLQNYSIEQMWGVLFLSADFASDPWYLRRSVLLGYGLFIYCAASIFRSLVVKRKPVPEADK